MKKTLMFAAIAGAIGWATLSFAQTQNPQLRVFPVRGNVYMLSGAGGNITLSVGPDGILMVDTGLANMSDKVIAAVNQLAATVATKGLTGENVAPPHPIRFIINTHVHPDHIGGNAKLALSGKTFTDGAARADLAIKKLGFARSDRKTIERSISPERTSEKDAGPLWAGDLMSKEPLKTMRATGDLGTAARCSKVIDIWRDEAGMPGLYFGMDELAKKTKLSPPKLAEFIEHLKGKGVKAARTHFDPKGLKTDLSARELLDHYKKFSQKR